MRTGAFGFRAAERLDSPLSLPRRDLFRLLPIEHQARGETRQVQRRASAAKGAEFEHS